MNYKNAYTKLINKALNRPISTIDEPVEQHHILPRSIGGSDHISNLVYLTAREHYVAHLLLYKMGYEDQIFGVKRFLDDSINPNSHRFGLFKWKRWLRKAVALRFAANVREASKVELTNRYLKKMEALNKAFEQNLLDIERKYAARFLDAVMDELCVEVLE